ncbi:MAG: DUF4124 domain-containing protein [Pseudomonadota bacterium]
MRYLLFLTLLLSTALQAGAIHKWVDEEGNIHYGDAPPVTVKTESVRVQSAPSNPGKSLPRLSTTGGDDATDSGTPAGASTDSPEVPKDQAKAACDQAKADLQVISRSSRIKLQSADGTERYLTTEEIEERKQTAQADVERFCN